MKLYLSGPMTGRHELNFPAFMEAAKRLRALGHEVVNPAELNPDKDMPWLACMKVDIKALCDCDGIALLPGWYDSKGAMIELELARGLGFEIGTTDDWYARARSPQ